MPNGKRPPLRDEPDVPDPVGVVGLGIMGSAYARHLLEAGVPTFGYDPAAAACERFAARGGTVVATPAAVAERARVVLSALASVEALDAVYLGDDGLLRGANPGTVLIEHSTFALADKERVRAALAARDVAVLDAPVSGTGAQAAAKDITVFSSGERAAHDAALTAMAAYARDVRYVGPFGTGSKLKYLANLLVTIHNLSTAEALVLGEKAGLDPQLIIDCLGESAATSRMFQVRGPMIAARTYQPAAMKMDVYDKDLHIIDDFARSVGAPTPLFSQSVLFYTAALSNGHAKDDTAAIAEVLRAMAGLDEER
jgi:3-hydroxyisobutyrate dehydrogenase-like beta-hydroxyacid dehydrogenase